MMDRWKLLACCVVLVIGIVGGLVLPLKISLPIFILGTIAFGLYLYYHPSRRYFNAFSWLVSAYLSIRAFPALDLGGELQAQKLETTFWLIFGDSAPWTLELAVIPISLLLLYLDFRTRSPDTIVPSNFSISNFLNFNRQVHNGSGDQFNFAANSNLTIEKSDFDSQIDAIGKALKARKADVVIDRLEELLRHSYDKLTDRQKYRVKASLANAWSLKGDTEKANFLNLEATNYQPDDSKVQSLRAITLSFLDRTEEARELAERLRSEGIENGNLFATLIRTCGDQSIEELQESIPSQFQSNLEVLYAVYWRATQRENFLLAESTARKMLKGDPDNDRIKVWLANASVTICGQSKKGRIELSPEDRNSKLHEAKQLVDEVIEKVDLPCLHTRARARYNRAFIHSYLGNDNLAENDFREALLLLPADTEMAYQYGIYMMQRNRQDVALKVFKECCADPTQIGSVVLMAQILNRSPEESDWQLAKDSLQPHIDMLAEYSANDRFDLCDMFGESCRKTNYAELAEVFFKSEQSPLDSPSRCTLLAIHWATLGAIEEANVQALEAHAGFMDSEVASLRPNLAQVLGRLGHHELALDVFKSFVSPSGASEINSLVISCAEQARDDEYLVQFCGELRKYGNESKYSVEREVVLLQEYNELDRAVDVIDSHLENETDEDFAAYLRLRKSIVGVRLGRRELLELDLNQLPRVSVVQPLLGCQVAAMLYEAGQPEKGIRYIYQLFRLHPGNPEVNRCMATLPGLGDDRSFKFKEPNQVGPGVAVEYREERSEKSQWRVIEDEFPPKQELREISAESSLGKELIGKSVGDEFFLRKDFIQDRKATVVRILHKVTFRQMDCLTEFENRFSDEFLSYAYDVPQTVDGEIDSQAFIDQLSKMDEPQRQIDKMITDHGLTPYLHASLSNRSVIASLSHFISTPAFHVRCCSGNSDEFDRASALLEENHPIVVDESALATLYFLNFHRKEALLPSNLLVSEGTLDRFRRVVQAPDILFSKRRTGKSNGRLYFHEFTDQELNEAIENFKSFYAWIENNFERKGGLGTTQIPVDVRDEIQKMYGAEAAESIGLAIAEKAVLWTDDQFLAAKAEELLFSNRVWTDLMLEHLDESKGINSQTFCELKVQLVSFGYLFTRVNPGVLKFAGEQCNWQADYLPLRSVIDWLCVSNVTDFGAAVIGLKLIQLAWTECALAHSREKIVKEVCRSIGKRPDAASVLHSIDRQLTNIFGFDVTSEEWCRQTVRNEIRLVTRERSLILPDDPDWRL